MGVTIPLLIGSAVSITGVAQGMADSANAAEQTKSLMQKQNDQQQKLIDDAAANDKKQQDATDQVTALQNAKNSQIAKNAQNGGRTTGTILTSPLASLAGTKGVPGLVGSSSLGGATGGTTSGKTLIGA